MAQWSRGMILASLGARGKRTPWSQLLGLSFLGVTGLLIFGSRLASALQLLHVVRTWKFKPSLLAPFMIMKRGTLVEIYYN